MDVDNFKSQIDKNFIIVNCFSSIRNVGQYLFKSNPSYIELKTATYISKLGKLEY